MWTVIAASTNLATFPCLRYILTTQHICKIYKKNYVQRCLYEQNTPNLYDSDVKIKYLQVFFIPASQRGGNTAISKTISSISSEPKVVSKLLLYINPWSIQWLSFPPSSLPWFVCPYWLPAALLWILSFPLTWLAPTFKMVAHVTTRTFKLLNWTDSQTSTKPNYFS